jgi:hypothetical protein|tara:strand:- start:93 stop:269 length:177 start_codon:yes stop_codon:yes gene_type:complete
MYNFSSSPTMNNVTATATATGVTNIWVTNDDDGTVSKIVPFQLVTTLLPNNTTPTNSV